LDSLCSAQKCSAQRPPLGCGHTEQRRLPCTAAHKRTCMLGAAVNRACHARLSMPEES
jgi:hypothetical protein